MTLYHKEQTPIEINENLRVDNLSSNTIGLGYLSEAKYCEEIGLDIKFINLCSPIFKYRNKVHFHVGDSINDPEMFLDLYERILSYSSKNIDSTTKQIDSVISDLIMLKKKYSLNIENPPN